MTSRPSPVFPSSSPDRRAGLLVAMETVARDARHALRLLRRDPTFTLTALATLALGIGLNTAIFSVAYGILWRPLPYPESDRLITIASSQQTESGMRTFSSWAPTSYDALRARTSTLEQLAAYTSIDAPMTGRGEPVELSALAVSPNFFATLDVAPALGRAFHPDATAADDDRSAIVSDRMWRTLLDGDPSSVGLSLTVDGSPRTIVGVLPPDFSFRPALRGGAPAEPDIFLSNRWLGDDGTSAFLLLLGRMKTGVTQPVAESELTGLINDPSVVAGGALGMEGAIAADVRRYARTVSLQRAGTESLRPLLIILTGAVFCVLLIACVNVANLQMARLSARAGELSVRMALGAGRRRIVYQLLTEAIVLSFAGAALGIGVAALAIDATLPLVPQNLLPRVGGITIDLRVMGFCLGLSLLSTLLIGLVPALRVSRSGFGESRALHAGATRTTGDRQGERLRTFLVSTQIAMTLVLLIGAGLLVHSFTRLTAVSPGFAASNSNGVIQTLRVTLPERLAEEPERIHVFSRDLLERIRHLPDIHSVSLINSMPFGRMFIQDLFDVEGEPRSNLDAGTPKIEPGYFATMGIPLLAGREFTPRDTASTLKVAIVSQRVIREYRSGAPAEALGARVRIGGRGDWLTVVGVVDDIRQGGLDEEIKPMIYVPFQQEVADAFLLRFLAIVARTTNPGSASEGIRAAVRQAAPDLPIQSVATMDEAVSATVAQPRFRMVLLASFGVAATVIATCGLYGLMAYAVTQRRREIGVRMALGATRADVLRLVITHALRVIAIGLASGIVLAAGVTRALRAFLFGVTPTDPLVFGIVTMLLLTVGLIAAWLPARRASRIDPWAAVRTD